MTEGRDNTTGRWPLARVIVIMALVLVALGGVNWSLNTDRSLIGDVAMLVLPLAWAIAMLVRRGLAARLGPDADLGHAVTILNGVVIGIGVVATVTMVLQIAAGQDVLGHMAAKALAIRAGGVTVGALLLLYGNAHPKMLLPVADDPHDPEAVDRLQRNAAWAYVIAGALIGLVWLFLPVTLATIVTLAILGGVVLQVAVSRLMHRGA